MPYANNNGVKIYYEVEGEGPPLVLAHPLTSSLGAWRRDGYVDALRSEYRLIMFDARGHGRSDKPHEAEACSLSTMATDVLSILDDVGVTKTHYFGYSLGSRVGFWLATHHREHFRSFILAGMTPYQIPTATVAIAGAMVEGLKLLSTDRNAYLMRQERAIKRALTEQEKQRLLAQDGEALIAVWTAWLNSPTLTDQDLNGISLPCLVYCGELDEGGFHPGAKECVNHIPNARFVSFPTLNHYQAGARSDLVLPQVREFMARIAGGSG
jgi:pimeloyl-ACP methyl ester carboxylesterase